MSENEWRLICPPKNWQGAIPYNAGLNPLLLEIALRLNLVHTLDEAGRKLYLGQSAPKERRELPAGAPEASEVRRRMKPGDLHLVMERDSLACFDAAGKKLWRVPALARGVNGSYKNRGGDTPPGLYRVTTFTETQPGEAQWIFAAFGRYFFDLYDLDRQERSRGRDGVGLHGGGTGLPDPLAPRQTLLPTHGCVRTHNEDLEKTIVPTIRTAQKAGNTVYLTVRQPY